MNTYNEDDQIVELKAWWEENGRSVLVGILLVVLSVGGWTTWNQVEEKRAREASAIYYKMIEAYQDLEQSVVSSSAGENRESEDILVKLSAFQQTVTSLKEEYGSSEYANYARLLSAKYYAMEGDLESAEKELREVLTSNPDKSMKLLAVKRLARVLAANKKYEDALKLLDLDGAGSYKPTFLELKGDIYFQKGEQDKALEAYTEARNLLEDSSPQLDMKYYNLLKG